MDIKSFMQKRIQSGNKFDRMTTKKHEINNHLWGDNRQKNLQNFKKEINDKFQNLDNISNNQNSIDGSSSLITSLSTNRFMKNYNNISINTSNPNYKNIMSSISRQNPITERVQQQQEFSLKQQNDSSKIRQSSLFDESKIRSYKSNRDDNKDSIHIQNSLKKLNDLLLFSKRKDNSHNKQDPK